MKELTNYEQMTTEMVQRRAAKVKQQKITKISQVKTVKVGRQKVQRSAEGKAAKIDRQKVTKANQVRAAEVDHQEVTENARLKAAKIYQQEAAKIKHGELAKIDFFIRENGPFLTVADMVEELGKSAGYVKSRCIILNIRPITRREQVQKFIQDHYRSKTPTEIAKRLDIGIVYLGQRYRELNLPFQKHSKQDRRIQKVASDEICDESLVDERCNIDLSVKDILGNFRYDVRYHYLETSASLFSREL